MWKRALVVLAVGVLAVSLLASAAAATPSHEPFIRILSPTVTLNEPGGPMIGPVQFRRFADIRVRYLCHPSDAEDAWQRFYVEPPFAHTSPYGDRIECDGRVRNEVITVPIGVDPYGSQRQTEPLTVHFGHLMQVDDSRDLRVDIRFERWQRTVAAVGPATWGEGVNVTFREGGSLDIDPRFAIYASLTVDRQPASPEEFIAALSPGDRLVAYGPRVTLRNR